MANIALTAQKRSSDENVKHMRADRMVPGVVYGRKQENISLKFDASEILRVYRKAGESHIISLDVEGTSIDVLIQEVQKEPVSGDLIHIDFYAIVRGEKVTAKIHLDYAGVSQAVKEGALLNENVKELEVSCLPRDLVDSFTVDLTLLKTQDDVIRLSDLNIDAEKYEVHTLHDDDAIASTSKAKVAQEEDEAADAAAAAEASAKAQEEAAAEEV